MTERREFIHRLRVITGLSLAAVAVMGTRACQEDYDLGSRTRGVNTPIADGTGTPSTTRTPSTPSPSPTSTGTGVVALPTGTISPVPTGTITAIVTGTATISGTPTGDVARSLKQDLAEVSEPTPAPSNWLGKAFNEKVNGLDEDKDGFTDEYENSWGSDPANPKSTPPSPTTRVSARFLGIDDDVDGLGNSEEAGYRTGERDKDTDRDGCIDGMEVISGSDPVDPLSRAKDIDGDCLDDDEETIRRLDVRQVDSDMDGLNDGMEIIFGTNPLAPDSDGDGILDGREIGFESDPTVFEPR